MKNHVPPTQISVWQIDGSLRSFAKIEPNVLNQAVAEVHSGHLFGQDRIIIADEDSEVSFVPPRLTRIDLVSDRVTVWDFPFTFGALIEVSEAEFVHGISVLAEQPDLRADTRFYFDIETVNGLHTYLEMDIVAGFPAARIAQIFSLLRGHQLIFGLRSVGLGVLNLSNVARFAILPEPVPIKMEHSSDNRRDMKLKPRPRCNGHNDGRSTSSSCRTDNVKFRSE